MNVKLDKEEKMVSMYEAPEMEESTLANVLLGGSQDFLDEDGESEQVSDIQDDFV